MRLCSFDGCERKHESRGFCAAHALQLRRGKAITPLEIRERYDSHEDSFYAKIQRVPCGGCWLWIAATDPDGYGFHHSELSTKRAHRYSFWLHNGYLTEGLMVRHLCHNPCCVNPDHLEEGTAKDNRRDAIQAGRASLGDEHYNSKKTHCPQGHEYTEDNVYLIQTRANARKSRTCKICTKVRSAEYKRKKRSEVR